MKYMFRQFESVEYIKLGSPIIIELKDFLPLLIKELDIKIKYKPEELEGINTPTELKRWLQIKEFDWLIEEEGYTDSDIGGIIEEQKYEEGDYFDLDDIERLSRKRKRYEFEFEYPPGSVTLDYWLGYKINELSINGKSLISLLDESKKTIQKETNSSWNELFSGDGERIPVDDED